MSWTTVEIVRKHLLETANPEATVEDEQHVLTGTDAVTLANAAITTGSEEVKTIDLGSPYSAGAQTLTGTAWSNLPHANLTPDSAVVTADLALDTVYIEGTDYVMDYELGKIKRVSGGAIPDGGTVYVWYFYYTVHQKDTDYTFDYDAGTLARFDGGAIADGSAVFVDYATSAGTVAEGLIEEAILEAEDKITARLAAGYPSDPVEQGIVTGATELALAIVCNAKAMDLMLKLPSDEADGAAAQWREMSRRYEAQAWSTLDRFLAARARRGSAAVRNESWEW